MDFLIGDVKVSEIERSRGDDVAVSFACAVPLSGTVSACYWIYKYF